MALARFLARPRDKAEIEFLTRKTVGELQALPGLEEIILFGSAARFQMTDASDLDLVLIFSTATQAKLGSKTAHSLRKPPHVPCDLLCVDRHTFNERSAIGGVLMVARDEGRTIYKTPES